MSPPVRLGSDIDRDQNSSEDSTLFGMCRPRISLSWGLLGTWTITFLSNLLKEDRSRVIGFAEDAHILTRTFESWTVSSCFNTSNFKSSNSLFVLFLEISSSILSKKIVDGYIFTAMANSHFTTSILLCFDWARVSFVTQNTWSWLYIERACMSIVFPTPGIPTSRILLSSVSFVRNIWERISLMSEWPTISSNEMQGGSLT